MTKMWHVHEQHRDQSQQPAGVQLVREQNPVTGTLCHCLAFQSEDELLTDSVEKVGLN